MRFAKILLFTILAASLSLFSSCDKSCSGGCGALQECVNGTCQCAQGLEGSNCEIKSNEKFVGPYQVYESYNPAFQGQTGLTFNCNIVAGNTTVDRIYFDNFAGLGLQVYGVINTIYITIPDQMVGATEVVGEGTFNTATRRMDLKYQITSGGSSTVATSGYQHQ